MSNSTSNILGRLGRSVSSVDKALSEQNETYDAPQLTPASSPEPTQGLDMQKVLSNALGLSSSKKHTPMD